MRAFRETEPMSGQLESRVSPTQKLLCALLLPLIFQGCVVPVPGHSRWAYIASIHSSDSAGKHLIWLSDMAYASEEECSRAALDIEREFSTATCTVVDTFCQGYVTSKPLASESDQPPAPNLCIECEEGRYHNCAYLQQAK